MNLVKAILIPAVTIAAVVAIIFRVKQVKDIVVG